MAHGARAFSCVRFDQETDQWLLFCQSCADRKKGKTFWPLDHNYWLWSNMSKCRECIELDKAAWIRERRRTDPEFKARQDALVKANRRAKLAIYQRNHRNHRKGAREPWTPPSRPNRPPTPVLRLVSADAARTAPSARASR